MSLGVELRYLVSMMGGFDAAAFRRDSAADHYSKDYPHAGVVHLRLDVKRGDFSHRLKLKVEKVDHYVLNGKKHDFVGAYCKKHSISPPRTAIVSEIPLYTNPDRPTIRFHDKRWGVVFAEPNDVRRSLRMIREYLKGQCLEGTLIDVCEFFPHAGEGQEHLYIPVDVTVHNMWAYFMDYNHTKFSEPQPPHYATSGQTPSLEFIVEGRRIISLAQERTKRRGNQHV